MTIGERIKAAREKAGLTQVQLGEKVGVSGVAIMRYENGTREPRYDRLKRISDALGISIYELFDGSTVDADGTINIWPAPQNASEEATPEELEALLEKLQDGKPLLLSPDKLAKLKATPKEQVAAALEKAEQEEQGHIVHISAPYYRLRGMSPERREQLKAEKDRAVRYEHSLGVSHLASDILGQLNAPQRRIAAALDKLNEEGQEKAAERVEELTEIPRYQVQEPPTAPPQDPPAPQEGKDTTSPADSPQRAQELPTGPSVIVLTMVCPLCARKITGNPVTKTAYCPNI